jgi:hypothetical protein
MNGSPNEAKVIAWKKNTKYEMRSKSSNKFQCVGPRQENMLTKLGSGKSLALVKAKKDEHVASLDTIYGIKKFEIAITKWNYFQYR